MCQLDNKDGQGFLLFWFVVGCADPSSLVNVSRRDVGSRAGAPASLCKAGIGGPLFSVAAYTRVCSPVGSAASAPPRSFIANLISEIYDRG